MATTGITFRKGGSAFHLQDRQDRGLPCKPERFPTHHALRLQAKSRVAAQFLRQWKTAFHLQSRAISRLWSPEMKQPEHRLFACRTIKLGHRPALTLLSAFRLQARSVDKISSPCESHRLIDCEQSRPFTCKSSAFRLHKDGFSSSGTKIWPPLNSLTHLLRRYSFNGNPCGQSAKPRTLQGLHRTEAPPSSMTPPGQDNVPKRPSP